MRKIKDNEKLMKNIKMILDYDRDNIKWEEIKFNDIFRYDLMRKEEGIEEYTKRVTNKMAMYSEIIFITDKDCEDWIRIKEIMSTHEATQKKIFNKYSEHDLFMEKYPFLKTTFQEVNINHMLPFPSQILEEFLYLGNAQNARSKDVMDFLDIKNIVNVTTEVGNILVFSF
eukprot:TRINITY_DN2940_c0_g1_i1.p1 TRINITY_DN2940_c0_g1~~TRINITY_DN2940_c0_g1_i1.p1  ORF type:complete len:197 (+),score=44.01 TRINITY_DN2940_c0_g1_i1:79-591(+)